MCLLKTSAHVLRLTVTTNTLPSTESQDGQRILNEYDGKTPAYRTGVYPSTVHDYRTCFICTVFYTVNPRGQTQFLCRAKSPTKVIFVSAYTITLLYVVRILIYCLDTVVEIHMGFSLSYLLPFISYPLSLILHFLSSSLILYLSPFISFT